MAVPVGGGFQNLVGPSGGTVGANTGLATTGKASASGLLGKAALSHCDGGLSGAKILTIAGGPLWGGKGFSLTGLGLGLGLGGWGPVIAFGAGAAAYYGYSNFLGQKAKQRRARSIPVRGLDVFKLLFGLTPPPPPPPRPRPRRRLPKQKKRLFSVLGFSVWR